MTKKHFIKIAADIKAYQQTFAAMQCQGLLRGLTLDLCDTFKADNPLFDKARFMAACGFGE